jgi:hypothetical protein
VCVNALEQRGRLFECVRKAGHGIPRFFVVVVADLRFPLFPLAIAIAGRGSA